MSVQEEVLEEVLSQEKAAKNNEIVLYNDDVNSFDHVIDCLVATCEHSPLQAEQCSLIVHYNGKCTVKTGELKKLTSMCTQLLNAGLSAEVV
jgi:ATP-dependent Clp protease adaptor protein ClpS